MNKLMILLWGIGLKIAFRCACIVFTITRRPVRGALVFIWSRNKILIVQKSYRRGWSIPGGMIKRGETRPQAAVRETFEEVGIHLNEDALVFIGDVPGDMGPNDQARLFEVQLESPPKIAIDGREIVSAAFVSPEEALQRDLDGHIKAYLLSSVD